MKVPVREEKRIDVRQTSTDFEIAMVPVLLQYVTEKYKVTKIKVEEGAEPEVAPKRQLDWHQVFTLLPIALHNIQEADTRSSAAAKDKAIEIKMELPSLDFAKEQLAALLVKIRKLPKKVLYAAAGGAIVLASLSVWMVTRPTTTAANTGTVHAPQLHRGTPTYTTILPAGENINQLGGWVLISPPKSAAVYTYVDHINGVQVNVSEQQLPAQLQSNTPTQLYQVAQNFGDDSKLTAGDTTFYIGTDASNAQSVILAKDNLLILMKSVQIVPNDKWISYISSMQ